MSEVFRLSSTVEINADRAASELRSIQNEARQTESVVNGTGGGINRGFVTDVSKGLVGVGKTMSLVGAGITAGMAGIVKAGSSWSAEVAGQQFLYNNLDKDIQKSISSNSKYAESIGLTTQQYKNGATDISTYYKNMGLTTEKTSELSGKTMDLAADLGAIKDVPFDEALGDFKSALMGNYEAVDKYGISLSASTLENSEFVKGLGKSWNQLSDNEKMMAAYSEITRQGASSNGLAKQEAEGFGIQMKLLWQNIKETVGTIGEQLLPVLQPLVQKFVEVAKGVADWVQENPKLTQTILLIVGGLGLLLAIVGPIIMAIGMAGMAMVGFSMMSAPVIGTIAGIIAVIGLLVAAGIYLATHWDSVKAKASEFGKHISDKFNEFTKGCSDKVSEMGKWVSSKFTEMTTSAKDKANEMKTKVVEKFNELKTNTINKFNEIKDGIANKLNEAKDKAVSSVTNIKNSIVDGFNNAKTNALSKFDDIKNGIKDKINSAKDGVKSAVDKIKGFFKFNWSLPKIKLPHFSISGKFSLNPPQKPTFGVEWYRNGGIMTNPTTFGFNPNTGKSMVGGEAGSEAIIPLKELPRLIKEMGYGGNSEGQNIVVKLDIDGREFARAVAKHMKEEIDTLNRRDRGRNLAW